LHCATTIRDWSLSTRPLLLFVTSLTGCVVEQTDAILAERGVTECSESTDESGESSDTSTTASADTGTSTSISTSTSTDDGGSDTSSTGESTASEDLESSSSTTGPALPVCGDGAVEGEETCDDGNASPGDGCQECAKDSIVFITSEVYQGFALGGLYGADQRCQSLAAKAGLERFLTYKAWLSTPTMSAADRLLHSRGRYVLVNGLVVAQNWDALTSGTLENSIMVDEKSMTQNALVWTGTLVSGQPALGSEFCEDWDDDSGLLKLGGAGLSASTDATWSFFEHNACLSEAPLYCVEQ
jgi:cysteine-rich repeat protein